MYTQENRFDYLLLFEMPKTFHIRAFLILFLLWLSRILLAIDNRLDNDSNNTN